MENYRKDLGDLVVVCETPDCKNHFMLFRADMEPAIKAGRFISCRGCNNQMVISKELEDYVKQTRCYS